jgi:outer membrane protein insertion porin family
MKFSLQKIPYILLFIALGLLNACTVVKNAPKGKPFVYNNKITITGNLSKDANKQYLTELANYWHDSMLVKKASSIGFFNQHALIYSKVIKNPPVFDTINFSKSARLMDNYLKSKGYYYANFSFDSSLEIKHKQIRITPKITITLGKNIIIDSISYLMLDTNQQQLIEANIASSFLKKGGAYSKQIISAELDRIVALFKQNGYYLFSRDNIFALVDTTDSKLLELKLDPLEIAKLLEDFEKNRKETPKWDVAILQKNDTTGKAFKKYYAGHTYFFPQASFYDLPDSVIAQPWLHAHNFGNYSIHYDAKIIKSNFFGNFIFYKYGQPFNQQEYYKTLNTLNKLGTWKQVDARIKIRNNDTLDIYFTMVPDLKQGLETTGEISLNSGDLTSGNLVGISSSISYRNRNVWKQAIQSYTSLRAGFELSPIDTATSIQTFFLNLNHTYSFPRIIAPKLPQSWVKKGLKIPVLNWLIKVGQSIKNAEDKRTLLSINAAYSDRFNLFKLTSINSSWGYEWRIKNKSWLYKPLNVELYTLDKLPALDTLIEKNPFLKLSFNTGNVIGQTLNYSKSSTSKTKYNRTNLFRVGFEESGLLAGLFVSLKNQIYRYGKIEVEYRQSNKFFKTEFAYKLFAGLGFNYGSTSSISEGLPFFKQFFVGGPNSMRAWGLRQLGPGSSLQSDTAKTTFKDRFGDIKLEANFEYRFLIYNGGFLKLSSALFADIGNIWNLKSNNLNANNEFLLSRLGTDLAIAIGTGLRFDFSSYFVFRVDVAYKLKDPLRNYNNGWAKLSNIGLTETYSNGVEARNASIQIGIGLPF